jgi:hypothetical protein
MLFELILWSLPWMISIKLSRLITKATSTTVPAWCLPVWSRNFMLILRWCRMMTMGLSYSLPLQGMLLWLILRSSVRLLGCQSFRFPPIPSMKWCWLLLWMSSGSSFMLSHRARSKLLPSGLVPCLPYTACLQRSSRTTSSLILKRVEFLYVVCLWLPFCLCKHILGVILEAWDESSMGLPFGCLLTQIILQSSIDVAGEPKMKIQDPLNK